MQELDYQIIKEPYNPTDPIVVIDPEYNKKSIIKEFEDPNIQPNKGNIGSNLKDDAINIPVIRLNNIVLHDEQIDYVKIYFNEFIPKVHLSIKDTENVIKICDAPGFDNEINIVITAEINGYYKKISLLFYITKFNIYGEYISYDGLFKMQTMNTDMFKQIGTDKLNTYNLLKEIAIENKLGFAATEKCENIKDDRYRIIQMQTYYDFINKQLEISGLDNDSIFDAWIDIFGYIVLVNVSYVFTEYIEPEQLTIFTMTGIHSEINDDNFEVTPVQMQRTLTNNKLNTRSNNLQFENYETIIDNTNIYKNGSLNTNFYLSSPCEDNIINTEQIQLIENSVDGFVNPKNYEFSKSSFIGIEFSEIPILFKKNINKRYFEKLKAKRIKIELLNYNLGLERGTLVNVVFKEYNNSIIKKLYKNNNEIDENATGVINTFATGMYYIDSIEFEYKTENHKIQQYLYLIKRSLDMKPINNSTGLVIENINSENN